MASISVMRYNASIMTNERSLKKIVIVEDNFALSDVYKTRLELLGYSCFVAYDGVQALSVIEKELPDLVLLDLMVPKIAGDQILERMRESDWGKTIKVMIISNLNEVDAPAGLRNLGIEAYAVKANLADDQIDDLVDAILKPAGQAEDVLLAHSDKPELQHIESDTPPAPPAVQDPMSGTRYSSPQPEASETDAPKPPTEAEPYTGSAPTLPTHDDEPDPQY